MTRTIAALDLAALNDSQLMAQVQAGSVRAFGDLYDRYSARAYRLALSVCRDCGDAEDAVQNAFVSIWRSPGGYHEERGTVSAWLLGTVRYRAIDIVNKNSTYAARLAPEYELDSCAVPDTTCEQVAALDETERMHALLGRLPAAQHEVIMLAFYDGLSHAEIARQLGLPGGTVKGRMRLGIRKLRATVERESA